ncbi:MAG: hypothetical protein COY40_01960 [Alphaproteobacteria bacterium CG_4_10_14_0_8_um_filter_53_9]|nr:MAG: hypothetical protein COY40_01960 [Alphaproteobacteria bacterium CG_4_10_14_0_8_um_filter_53_9]
MINVLLMLLMTRLAKDALLPTFVACALMLGLLWLLQSLRFLDFVVNKGFGLGTFLSFTLLMIPRLLEIVWPLSVFAGATYALRRWQDDNELVAMLSAGISFRRIFIPLFIVGLMAVLVGLLNSWLLLPRSMTAFKDMQHTLRNEQGHLLLEEGIFNQVGDNLMVYVNNRKGNQAFNGLLVHDTRESGRPVTWLAKQGSLSRTEAGTPVLVLEDGMRQSLTEKRVEMLQFGKHTLDISTQFGEENTAPRMRASEEYGWSELSSAALTSDKLRAEWHKRLVWPLASLLAVFVAAGWLLRTPLPRQSSNVLVTGAVVTYVVVWVALLALLNMTKDGMLNAIMAQWALLALLPPACYLLMGRRS